MMKNTSRVSAAGLLLIAATTPGLAQQPSSAKTDIDFNRDVRPILAGKCFQCHGPDDKVRKAGLRLDLRSSALAELQSGAHAIVPGKPSESELLRRIRADADEVMPPPRSGKRLTADEVGILERWIEHGAPYAQHWALLKPRRAKPPATRNKGWPRNPIDSFILARLEKEGLQPAPEADRYALARRLALDLTGLPPTLEQVDRFAADKSPAAYEDYVERLLSAPAYGERWAHVWLDLARYADSQGYASDPDRTIWRWRDWVIQALNDNTPFDRFTIDQLAGDLEPQPTTAQLIATGFHRNTMNNTEGGITVEEFRSAAVVDRVNTTFQAWLGLTIACAQCHNHKYDPFTQKEFFQLYAIFNNSEDSNGDTPALAVAQVGQEKAFAEASARLAEARKRLEAETRAVDAREAAWEKAVDKKSTPKEIAEILLIPAAKRDKTRADKVLAYHRGLTPAWKALDAAARTWEAKVQSVSTTTPIMRENTPRATRIQIRGNFLDQTDLVTPGLPAALPQAEKGKPVNRLALARWLVSPDNPLTARVTVNRLWEELFGVGIVETSENFGTRGEPPSHPELLDWLAVEYVRSGWDSKRMLKLMVSSAAYRQSSAVSKELASRDPSNRLLARGPRFRLPAETIRDQALFAGGLLSPKMYGPPIQPPRPVQGLAAAFGGGTDWTTSSGTDQHRRGLYVRWRRNSAYPSLVTFDAPERSLCNVRRLRTNTPLQALVTLNDPVYVEAAQALGRRMARAGDTSAARAAHGFRLCLSRPPRDEELKRLVALFDVTRKQFTAAPADAASLATKPLGPASKTGEVAELAAWTVVANVLLNLDETLAKR